MQLSYDPNVNIAYLRLKKKTGKVRTLSISDELNIDLAPDGSIFGIEMLNANKQLGTGSARSRKFQLINESSGQAAELALGV